VKSETGGKMHHGLRGNGRPCWLGSWITALGLSLIDKRMFFGIRRRWNDVQNSVFMKAGLADQFFFNRKLALQD